MQIVDNQVNSVKPLPKIDVPIYSFIVPSSGEEIKVRPFTVKEEKLLLMAAESDTSEDIVTTTKQIINNCIVSGNLNVDKTPFFDIDFIFIFLRAKSIGETVEVNLTCNNTLENGLRCGHTFPTMLDISKNELVKNEDISNDIKLDDLKGIKMKYPTYSLVKNLDKLSEMDRKTKIIINSIDNIYDKKGIYPAKDYSTKELENFVESLTEENYRKLEDFVMNFPTFIVNLEATCPKCGFHHVVRYSDFHDFFY